MPVITRASLPEEFFDITSAQLLVAPDQQYVHALLAKSAMACELNVDAALGLPGRSFSGNGADYAAADQGRLMLSDPIMSEAITAVAELGTAPGHTIRMNRPKFTDSLYTLASREVAAGSTISTTPIDISSEQVAITIKRLAGPHSGSAVAPYAVDRFDAQKSIHKLSAMVGMQLKRDHDKTLNQVLVSLYDAAFTTLYPTGFAADNDFAEAGDGPMDWDLITRSCTALDVLNVPTFANGKRVMILHPQQAAQVQNDASFAKYAKYHADVNPLIKGSYLASLPRLEVFISNGVTSTANSSSVPVYRAQMFGPGMVGMGVGEMPRVAYSADDNYGEQAKVIWLMYAGFATLDSRFGVSLRSS